MLVQVVECCVSAFICIRVHLYACTCIYVHIDSVHRHSPFRSSNAKSKEEIDHQTLTKVC